MSMVSDFIIRPALRQVRRFSRSSITSESESTSQSPPEKSKEQLPGRDGTISETEEDSYLKDAGDENASPLLSSQSSIAPTPSTELFLRRNHSRLPDSTLRVAPESSVQDDYVQVSSLDQNDDILEHMAARQLDLHASSPITGEPIVGYADGNASSSATTYRPRLLPEDDGMGALRKRILEIQAKKLPAPEQARLIHELLMESYNKSQLAIQFEPPLTPTSAVIWEQTQAQGRLESFKFWQNPLGEAQPIEKFTLTKDDIKPSFAPLRPSEDESEYRPLGCEHYRRNVKLQCATCGRWYTCRFCHDKIENHPLVRKDTKNMLCMFCGNAQRAGETCVACGESASLYYCQTCKLWDNDPDKNIYHCSDCGICRIGRGLGKDFFHCKKCCACLAISIEQDHKCIERSLDCDCPICGEYMFNSTRPVCFMKCGHAIHRVCWDEHIKTAYKCPICSKSVVNMETQFRNLDIAIRTQPMPEKFRDTRAFVHCNDCSTKTTVKYHWLGLKCAVCHSYNTSEIQILGAAATSLSESRPSELSNTGTSDTMLLTESIIERDIPRRRRHSSNLMGVSTENLDAGRREIGTYVVQDRLARSVSPSPNNSITHRGPTGAKHIETENIEDEEEEEDMLGLWSRIPRSLPPNEDPDELCDLDDDSSISQDEDMDDDDEDDEEEEGEMINLIGHR